MSPVPSDSNYLNCLRWAATAGAAFCLVAATLIGDALFKREDSVSPARRSQVGEPSSREPEEQSGAARTPGANDADPIETVGTARARPRFHGSTGNSNGQPLRGLGGTVQLSNASQLRGQSSEGQRNELAGGRAPTAWRGTPLQQGSASLWRKVLGSRFTLAALWLLLVLSGCVMAKRALLLHWLLRDACHERVTKSEAVLRALPSQQEIVDKLVSEALDSTLENEGRLIGMRGSWSGENLHHADCG